MLTIETMCSRPTEKPVVKSFLYDAFGSCFASAKIVADWVVVMSFSAPSVPIIMPARRRPDRLMWVVGPKSRVEVSSFMPVSWVFSIKKEEIRTVRRSEIAVARRATVVCLEMPWAK